MEKGVHSLEEIAWDVRVSYEKYMGKPINRKSRSWYCIDRGISDLTRLEQDQIDDYDNKVKEVPLVNNRYHQSVIRYREYFSYRLRT